MVREQSLLVRVVRMPDRSFAIERNMKLNGRGAYLCDNVACLEKAVKKRGLDRSFREKIDAARHFQLSSSTCAREVRVCAPAEVPKI